MTQKHKDEVAYHAKELYKQERDCLLRFLLTGLPEQIPADVLMFSWCVDRGYIDYSDEQGRYVVSQKGYDHVQRS